MRLHLDTTRIIHRFLRPKSKTKNFIFFETKAKKKQIIFYFIDFFDIKPLRINTCALPKSAGLKKAIVKLTEEDFEKFYKNLGEALKISSKDLSEEIEVKKVKQ